MYINIYSTNDSHVMVITDCSHFLGHLPLIRCLRWPIKATLLSQSRRTGDQWEPKSAQKLFFGHRNLLKNEKCWSKILRKVMLIYLIYLKKCWSDVVELRIGWSIGGSSWTMLNYVELAKTLPLGFPIEGRVPRSAAVSTNCFALCLRSLASRYIETYSDRLNKVLFLTAWCLDFFLVLDLSFHHPLQ